METECTPKTFIPWKFFIIIKLSSVTGRRKSKIDQVESRSVSCAGRKRGYADISWFCAIVDYFSGVKISVAIKLIEGAGWVISTTYEQGNFHEPSEWLEPKSSFHQIVTSDCRGPPMKDLIFQVPERLCFDWDPYYFQWEKDIPSSARPIKSHKPIFPFDTLHPSCAPKFW